MQWKKETWQRLEKYQKDEKSEAIWKQAKLFFL